MVITNPLGPINYGRDFNFFANATPGSAVLGTFATNADVVITFPTYTVTFWMSAGLGAGSMQYSFNGTTVHGTIDSTGATGPTSLIFENRPISKIWLSGTGTVRIEAWGTR